MPTHTHIKRSKDCGTEGRDGVLYLGATWDLLPVQLEAFQKDSRPGLEGHISGGKNYRYNVIRRLGAS